VTSLRRAVTRKGLVPVPGAVETIVALRERGLKIGLITVCSEDVVSLWEETASKGSSTPRSSRPPSACASRTRGSTDWRWSCWASSRQRRSSSATGANDELAGAERVGMRAIGVDSPSGELGDWDGAVIRELPELRELV
jgi:hypothetical protein